MESKEGYRTLSAGVFREGNGQISAQLQVARRLFNEISTLSPLVLRDILRQVWFLLNSSVVALTLKADFVAEDMVAAAGNMLLR